MIIINIYEKITNLNRISESSEPSYIGFCVHYFHGVDIIKHIIYLVLILINHQASLNSYI